MSDETQSKPDHQGAASNTVTVDRIPFGMGLMTLAMLLIPLRDGLAKHMTETLPVFTIAWGTYVAAAIFAVPLAMRAHGIRSIVPFNIYSQTIRTLLLVSSMTVFFFSVRTVPLANAISAFFVGPFISAGLAPFVLKERTTKTIIVAVTVGFLGVLLVLRPDGQFDANILWAVFSGVLFGFYMLATRLAAKRTPPLAALAYQTLLGAVVLTPFAMGSGFQGMAGFWTIFCAIGLIQAASHSLSISAFRFAPAGILAPLVYLEIVGASLVGLIGFGDWPVLQTWIGIIIILAAGALVAVKRQ